MPKPSAAGEPTPIPGIAPGASQPPPASYGAAVVDDPLFAALAVLSGMLGRPVSVDALKSGLPRGRHGFSPELCVRAAERSGLAARIVKRKRLKSILPVTLPCILLMEENNACILTAFKDNGEAEIATPEVGGARHSVPVEQLEAQYTGYALFARPKYGFDSRAQELRIDDGSGWFWGTLGKFWPIYSHVVLASILINMFAIAIPIFIMTVYDRVVPNQSIETLWVLAIGVAIVIGFEFLMRNLRSYFVDVAGKNADVIMASRLLQHVMGMRLDHKPPSTGALANNLRDFEILRDFFTSGTLVALVDLPFIFLFILVIWFIAGELALVPLAVAPVILLVGAILQVPLRRVIEDVHRETAQKHALLVETIEGLETIKTASGEGRMQANWEHLVGVTAESSRKARAVSTLSTSLAQFLSNFTTIAVIVYGVYLIGDGAMTMGALVAATILTSRAMAPLGVVVGLLTRVQQSRVALKSIDALMKAPLERPAAKTFVHRPRIAGSIRLKEVEFAYPGQAGKALNGASFEIKAGERAAIIGRIGSGKSTIARLLVGLYTPQAGTVLLDGTDAQQIDPTDLRRNIGYVSQDNQLFFGSVRENVSLGTPQFDDPAIERALAIAGIGDFVKAHPHGLDMQVGERGTNLSGGQRQGITIARALLTAPPVLLLDEPTSQMDRGTEKRFIKHLDSLLVGRTLVLITHRGSMLDLVQRLIVMDGGRVVADGAKQQVLDDLKAGRLHAPA